MAASVLEIPQPPIVSRPTVVLRFISNPLDMKNTRQSIDMDWEPNLTVTEVMEFAKDRFDLMTDDIPWRCICSANPEDLMPDDEVIILPEIGFKNPIINQVLFALGGAALGGFGGVALGLKGGTFAGLLGSSFSGLGAIIGSSVGTIVAGIISPPISFKKGFEASPAFAEAKIGINTREGLPVPVVYGEHRVGGTVIAFKNIFQRSVTKGTELIDPKKNDLFMVVAMSEGEVEDMASDPSGNSLEINGQSTVNFQGNNSLQIDSRKGTLNQKRFVEFQDIIKNVSKNSLITVTFDDNTFTTTKSVNAVSIEIDFPSGLFRLDKKGDVKKNDVVFSVDYQSDTDFASDPGASEFNTDNGTINERFEIRNDSASRLSAVIRIPKETKDSSNENPDANNEFVTFDKYHIRIRRLTAQNQDAADELFEENNNAVGRIAIFCSAVYKLDFRSARHINTPQLGPFFEDTDYTKGSESGKCVAETGNWFASNAPGAVLRFPGFTKGIVDSNGEFFSEDSIKAGGLNTISRSILVNTLEIVSDDLIYPNVALFLVGVRSDLLSGSIPNFTTQMKGLKVRVATGSDDANGEAAFAVQWTQNPAWCVFDMLTKRRYALGKLTNIFINDLPATLINQGPNIDVQSFQDWADYCDELVDDGSGGTQPRCEFDMVYDVSQPGWDAVQAAAATANATVFRVGRIYRAVIDRDGLPTQLFNETNIIEGSFNQSIISKRDQANFIEVQFRDRAKNFDFDIVSRREDVATLGDDPIVKQQINGFGVTRRPQARRLATRFFNINKVNSRMVEFDAGLESLASEPGDLVNVSNRMFKTDDPETFMGGRITGGSTTTVIQLDRDVTIDGSFNYEIQIRFADDSIATRAVVNTPGTSSFITVSSAFSQAPLGADVYVFGQTNVITKIYRILNIDRKGDNIFGQRHLACLEHNVAVFDDAIIDDVVIQPGTATTDNEPPPHVQFLSLQLNRKGSRIKISWAPPNSFLYKEADVFLSDDGETFDKIGSAFDFLKTEKLQVGLTYFVRVVSRSFKGISARDFPDNPIPTASILLRADPCPTEITKLKVRGKKKAQQPDGTWIVWGKNFRFKWKTSSLNAGANTQQANESAAANEEDEEFRGYKIFVFTGKVEQRDVDTAKKDEGILRSKVALPPGSDSRFKYRLDDNMDDGDGVPARTITIAVKTRYSNRKESCDWRVATATNPAPRIPGNFVSQLPNPSKDRAWTVKVRWNTDAEDGRQEDSDIEGFLLWAGTTATFTPSADNLVYCGKDNKFRVFKSTDFPSGRMFFKLAAFDTFALKSLQGIAKIDPTGVGLNISNALLVDVTGVTDSELEDEDPLPIPANSITCTALFKPAPNGGPGGTITLKASWAASPTPNVAYKVKVLEDGVVDQDLTDFTDVGELDYRWTGLETGTDYRVKVKPVFRVGSTTGASGAWETSAICTTPDDNTPPNSPSSVTRTTGIDTDDKTGAVFAWIKVSFTPSTSGDVEKHKIELTRTGDGEVTKYDTDATDTSFIISPLPTNTTYEVRIKAKDKTGNPSSLVDAVPLTVTTPRNTSTITSGATPTSGNNVVVQDGKSGDFAARVTITAEDYSGDLDELESIIFKAKKTSDSDWKNAIKIVSTGGDGDPDGVEVATFGLEANVSYDFKYRYQTRRQNVSNKSAWSTPVTIVSASDSTPPAAPSALSMTVAFKTIFGSITSPSDSDLSTLELWCSEINDRDSVSTPAVLAGSARGTPGEIVDIAHTGLGYGDTRFYWVRGVDRSGNGGGVVGNGNWFPDTGGGVGDGISATTLKVGTADYANLSIVNAAINDLSADKINVGTLNAGRIATGSLHADKITAGTITGTHLAATTLSTIFANIGEITSGIIRNATSTFIINLSVPSLTVSAAGGLLIDAIDGLKVMSSGGIFMNTTGSVGWRLRPAAAGTNFNIEPSTTASQLNIGTTTVGMTNCIVNLRTSGISGFFVQTSSGSVVMKAGTNSSSLRVWGLFGNSAVQQNPAANAAEIHAALQNYGIFA